MIRHAVGGIKGVPRSAALSGEHSGELPGVALVRIGGV